MNRKQILLNEYFGHSSFRNKQEQIIDCLLSGRDVLCVMPTGAGKSICYQVPALMFDGITLVVSPLISLMKDQVSSLIKVGIPAAYINSSLSPSQISQALFNAENYKYKIIYVTPERLGSPEFLTFCQKVCISMVAVDEAHCVSQWGQDFRPTYLNIVRFIESLSYRPVIGAFTATARNEVIFDIKRFLGLKNPLAFVTGFDRPNLFFSVIHSNLKPNKLIELLNERSGKSGIVYCNTRSKVEDVFELLCQNKISAVKYHAGLSALEREKNQDDFIYNRKSVMVATNAFGMGIDKSDISFVIHYNMPKSIEDYYQEVGRAGRNGEDADCILLYNRQDISVNQLLIDSTVPNPQLSYDEQRFIYKRDMHRLEAMALYCTTKSCLRHFILNYFGDTSKPICNKCSNCIDKSENK